MKIKKMAFWVLDRLWPTLEPLSMRNAIPKSQWTGIGRNTADVIEAAYDILKDEIKAQNEDLRIVDSKLQSISSLAPIMITILIAVVVFLTGDKFNDFPPMNILIVVVEGGYVALQFLRAFLAAISGLSREVFQAIPIVEIPPKPNETKEQFLIRTCDKLSHITLENREAINRKVSQLALGHASLKNAAVG